MAYGIIDVADWPKIADRKWKLDYRHDGEPRIGNRSTDIARVILDAPHGLEADHLNHDRLDNRRCNLRLATRTENNRNQRPRGKSEYKGVYWQDNRWRVRICVNRKRIYIGSFKSEDDAARAYDDAAREHHGAFARLNFPQREEAA